MITKNSNFIKELDINHLDFINELENINKSKNTIDGYNSTIISFINFLKEYDEELNYKKITTKLINRFIQYKNDISNMHKKYKPGTKQLYINHIHYFFQFIEQNNELFLDFDNVFKNKALKVSIPKKIPKGLNIKDVEKLEKYIDTVYENLSELSKFKQITTVRNIFMYKLYLFTGIRCSEMIPLKIEDLINEDKKLYKIYIHGKGSKDRVVFLSKRAVKKEVKFYKELGKNYIAETSNKTLMDRVQIWRSISRIYKKAGVKESSLHILRHTFAKKLYQDTKDLLTVSGVLGHSSIKTTQIYADVNEETIKKNYKKSMIKS